MSNGLERELPEVAWQAVPPIGPRGIPPETVRGYVAHGRELRSRAIRDAVRSGRGAVVRGLLALRTISRRSARGPAKRRAERDSWASFTHGA